MEAQFITYLMVCNSAKGVPGLLFSVLIFFKNLKSVQCYNCVHFEPYGV